MSALPGLQTALDDASERLADWLAPHHRVFVLTGAGCSTDSGIPDYRDQGGEWKRRPPITFQGFVGDPLLRARYWARSFVGWPAFSMARPNATHYALADFEQSGRLSLLLTQNVDQLHQRAGSERVVDLHGRLDEVVCLDCHRRTPRAEVQQRLAADNPDWQGREAAIAPDGDADLEDADFAAFRVPACEACGGLLKPDVVFFGENVPRLRVSAAHSALEESDAMLVVGSSLMVYSGFRFARAARDRGLPLAILTQGVTRADAIATLKLQADCGTTLTRAFDLAGISMLPERIAAG